MAADNSDDEFQRISDADHAKIADKMEKVSKTSVCVYCVSSKSFGAVKEIVSVVFPSAILVIGEN